MKIFLRQCLCLYLCLMIAPSFANAIAPGNSIKEMTETADTFAAIIEKAKPAVVYLQVKKEKADASEPSPFSENELNDPVLKEFFGDKLKDKDGGSLFSDNSSYGFGSGFLFTSDGYILTNSHVIRDAVRITVTLADKRSMEARIIGEDQKTDIGLIKIDETGLPSIPLGDSENLKCGHWVLAIGSPYEFIQTVTAGIISATGRNSLGISDYESFIQTDAAINPGNSGGPLLNIQGQAIGINTAFLTKTGGYMGIGFAIPINMARVISERLLADGKVTRAWVGLALKDAEAEHLQRQGLPPATQAARIVGVTDNSPAARAGLQEGDLLTAINNTPIKGAGDFRNRIALSIPNSEAILEYYRNGSPATVKIILGTLQ